MTRIVCISDTHTKHRKLGPLPAGDVLIHAGDMTFQGRYQKLEACANWLRSLDFKHKIVIAGNHDIKMYAHPNWARLFHGLHYLNETSVEVEGLKVFGSPWSPWFDDRWAFGVLPGKDAQDHWAKIPDDTDICVVHGSPHGYGDTCEDGRAVGCPSLAVAIERIQPKLVVSGHVHEAYGVYETPWGTKIVNACVLDAQYKVANAPIVVDL